MDAIHVDSEVRSFDKTFMAGSSHSHSVIKGGPKITAGLDYEYKIDFLW